MSSESGKESNLNKKVDTEKNGLHYSKLVKNISPIAEDQSGMVTTKGAGLNPNAKVWQEIPTPQSDVPEGTEGSLWLQTSPSSADGTGVYTDASLASDKGYTSEEVDPSDISIPLPIPGIMDSIDHSDLGYPIFEPLPGSQDMGEESVAVEQQLPMSEESLRESLKKQLEFCFSRENLSKDLYLISQMDSDQFVPIWTIASMENIKILTTDMDLILEVLRASPMVQVDEKGEKVRPNHKRCIIILREVPETTPVEEVDALFKNENCPKVISVEFAHNNNWYITFQSDTDAQQAYRYLREEVKTFQGKPIMARIKAINTFFAKNGYRTVDSSVYAQTAQPQPQSQYTSPLYMQQVYSPQQQYPLYPLVPPTWNQAPTPYFETPLAPFPNAGFVNGFSSNPGNYKTSSNALGLGRPFNRNRNHVKSIPRPGDGGLPPSMVPVPLMEGLSGPSSPPAFQTTGAPLDPTLDLALSPSLTFKDTLPLSALTNGDFGMAGRGRWVPSKTLHIPTLHRLLNLYTCPGERRGSYRGTRRRREDERIMRPITLTEVKAPSPKFDLAASNFPPLPGCVLNSTQEEPVLETRMSDVVRGIKVADKVSDGAKETPSPISNDDPVSTSSPVVSAPKPIPLVVKPPVPSLPHLVKRVEKTELPVPKETTPTPMPPVSLPASLPVDATKTLHIEAVNTASSAILAPTATPAAEPRKLSYAEVCQRPATAAPTPTPSPTPPAPSPSPASQPLRELRVNKVEECASPHSASTDRAEKLRDSRPPRDYYRGGNGHSRAGGMGLKHREHQRGPPMGRRISPQGARRSGKEQNIPPRSPK
ncbi:la-related protein 4 [Aplochiton taeniatus]